jgi:hypothetical protein
MFPNKRILTSTQKMRSWHKGNSRVTLFLFVVLRSYIRKAGRGYKYGDLALQVEGVSRIGTMVLNPAGLRWRGPAATVNCRPILSAENALQNNHATV